MPTRVTPAVTRPGIANAMREELHALLREVVVLRREWVAGRILAHATLAGTPVVLALAGVGNVAAELTRDIVPRALA